MYERITPLPDDTNDLAQPELRGLAQVWAERRATLETSAALTHFLQRLRREWAIETGIIERLYSWDRGVTEVLLEQGIEASLIAHRSGLRREEAERVTKVIHDQLNIIDGLFDFVKREMPLTEHYIRSMHAKFTEHQDTVDALTPAGQLITISLLKGEYKQLANNPRRPDGTMHEYCPPEFVRDEMQNLVAWYSKAEASGVEPEVLSAWLHHRFTQIHPFQDGNGRIARALATLVFLRHALFPLVIRDEPDRKSYIGALEAADDGDLLPLVKLFARRQKESILQALGIERELAKFTAPREILSSAIQALRTRADRVKGKWSRVFDVAKDLHKLALDRLTQVAAQVNDELRAAVLPGQRYEAWCADATTDDERSTFYYKQIVATAKALGYYANRSWYRSWILLDVRTTERFELLVSIHGVGRQFQGVLVASAMTFRRILSEDEKSEIADVQPAAAEVFQFNYAEPEPEVHTRFNDWLTDVLTIALEQWRRTLEA